MDTNVVLERLPAGARSSSLRSSFHTSRYVGAPAWFSSRSARQNDLTVILLRCIAVSPNAAVQRFQPMCVAETPGSFEISNLPFGAAGLLGPRYAMLQG